MTVAFADNLPPYSFVTADGEKQGYVKDLWDLWADKTGVAVTYRRTEAGAVSALVASGGAQVAGAIAPADAGDGLRVSTKALASVPVRIYYSQDIEDITAAEILDRFTVGIVEGRGCGTWLLNNRVFYQRSYPTLDHLLDAAGRGEVNVFCSGDGEAPKGLRERGLGLSFNVSSPIYSADMHWATRAGDDALHAFVADGFAMITPAEREQVARRWFGKPASISQYRLMVRLTWFLLAALGAVIVAVAWNVIQQAKVRSRTAELAASHARAAAILNCLPVPVWIKDVDGRYLAANQALASLCGERDAKAMIGRTDQDYFPRDIAEIYRRNDTMVVESMALALLVEPFSDPGGTVRWIESTKAPYFDERGWCAGTIGTCRDITSRPDDQLGVAMASLRQSESRYHDLISALPVGVFEIDRHGTVVFANEVGWTLAGEPAAPGTLTWASLVHGDDGPDVVEALRAMLETGDPLNREFRLVSASGRETWVHALGVRRAETGGAVISLLDIGGRRLADERLRAREEEFRALVEQSPDMIARYDLDARRTFANPALSAMAGVAVQDLLGKLPSQGSTSPHLQAYEKKIREVGASGRGGVFELTWNAGDGRKVVSEIRLVPERGKDGAVVSVISVGRDVTHQKAIEVKLRDKSDTLAALLDNLPGNAFTMRYGPDGRKQLLFTTLSLEDICRLPQSAPDIRDYFHHDDHFLLFVEVPDRLRRLGFSEHKFRFRRDDGTVIWLHARERVREWQGGDMIVDGLVFDVTEEVEAKELLERTSEQLRETAGRLGRLVDHLPGLVYRKEYRHDDSRILYASAGFREITGREFDGGDEQQRLDGFWHPDDHDRLRECWAAIRGGADRAEVAARCLRADGSVRWVRLKERVVERRGDRIAAEGLMLDITDEMEAKHAYQENADELLRTATKLRTLVDNLPGVIFRMEYLGPGSKRMLELYGTGVTGDAALLDEEEMRRLVHPDDVDLVYGDMYERLQTDGIAEQTFRMAGPGGRYCWIHTREKVMERAGERLLVEGQAIDVTAEVMTRQDLEDSENRRRRAEARLLEGRRLEALGQFAGGIAHDFNNLLGAMLGYARFIVEDAPAASDNRRHAARILEIGEKGRAIVEQILSYSRRSELIVSRFKVGDLLAELSAVWDGGAGRPPLHTDHSLGHLVIEADRVQLSRMLMNLTLNSCDAMDGRGGSVSVGAHQTEFDHEVLSRLVERDNAGGGGDVEAWTDGDGNSWVVAGRLPKVLPHVALYVSDSGVGMEAKLLEQAFKPFFTTKDRSRGTGLGLAVVHGVAIAHGGAIIGRSRPGEGTRFDVLLPVRRSPKQPVDVFVPVAEPARTSILLVDDNVDVLEATAEALKRIDYAVDAFSNPQAALEAFRATPQLWDLVITDQIMPALKGIDLVKALRAVRPDVPCVLCSGYADELNSETCAKAGISTMLRKPVGMSELLAAITNSIPD